MMILSINRLDGMITMNLHDGRLRCPVELSIAQGIRKFSVAMSVFKHSGGANGNKEVFMHIPLD